MRHEHPLDGREYRFTLASLAVRLAKGILHLSPVFSSRSVRPVLIFPSRNHIHRTSVYVRYVLILTGLNSPLSGIARIDFFIPLVSSSILPTVPLRVERHSTLVGFSPACNAEGTLTRCHLCDHQYTFSLRPICGILRCQGISGSDLTCGAASPKT